MFQNFFNYYNLQSNPIYLDIYKYKNLKVNSDSLMTSVKNVKPKVIISDFLVPRFMNYVIRIAK